MINKDLVEKVSTFIVECSEEKLKDMTVTELTRYFSISKTYLTRKFKRGLGLTPGKFILREKMRRAAYILEQDEELKIKDLTELMGFYTYDYFIRVFKAHTGLSPARFREIRMRNNR